jgi:acyl-coenzyme A synthetase/AMP-(fatty) acid ligase/acyl carrier protein
MWMQDYFGIDASDVVLQKTPYSFDVSVWEFFWPLMVGARLVVAEPGGHRDAGYLVRTIVDHGVTTVHFVPSMLRLFLEHPDVESCESLQRVICSGEALSVDLVERFFARLSVPLFNLYGPTEAAVDVTYWECRRGDPSPVVPIGNPVANTQIHILDDQLRRVPIGVSGELHIGGVQVADGYVNRPELTSERFVADPFRDEPGARLYRTGDLARYRSDGAIEFLGRADFQVKIRGNRIELGEIEATLGAYPGVQQAVVRVWDGEPGDERLLGYVKPKNGEIDEVDLREFLKHRLPRYMLPSRVMTLDEIPMTANGKVDRKALPLPDGDVIRVAADRVAPRTPLEEDVAATWSSVLGIRDIGVLDDFFDLGGHSLDAMRVNARVGEQYGVEVSLGSFFENPTVEGQALAITGAMASQVVDADELKQLVAELGDTATGERDE